MTKLIVDTNIFLRLILNDIPKQADEVEKLLNRAKKDQVKLLVPQIIIFEIEYALSKFYKFPKDQIVDKLDAILSAPYFFIQDGGIFKRAVLIYKDKNFSLVDCFLRAKSEIEETEIFTFDQKLVKLKGE